MMSQLDKLKDIYETMKINTINYTKNLNNIINIIVDNGSVTNHISDKYDTNMLKFMNDFDQLQHNMSNVSNYTHQNSYIFDYDIKYAINEHKYVHHKCISSIDNIKINVYNREIILGNKMFILLNSTDIIVYHSDPEFDNPVINYDIYIDTLRNEISKLNSLLSLIDDNLIKILAIKNNINKYLI